MNKYTFIRLFTAVAALFSGLAAGQQPVSLVWNGKLRQTDYSGSDIEGSYAVRACLYDSVSAETPKWARTLRNVAVDKNGNFAVVLSDSIERTEGDPASELESVLSGSGETSLFLGLTIGEDGEEIRPRVRFASQPRVISSMYAQSSSSEDFAADSGARAKSVSAHEKLLEESHFRQYSESGAESVDLTEAEASLDVTSSGGVAVEGNMNVMKTLSLSGSIESADFTGFGQVPAGTIVAYAGEPENLPDEWKICDGQNGTPNLTSRFLVGAGKSYASSMTGGADAVRITVSTMASHSHAITITEPGDIKGYPNGWRDTGSDYWWKGAKQKSALSAQTGGGGAHNNLPPYYCLYYIMRVR